MANASSLTTSRMELLSFKAEPLLSLSLSLRSSTRTEEAVTNQKIIKYNQNQGEDFGF